MSRAAKTDYPILELFIERHSPYAFDPARSVDAETVHALFEAARWTMSSYNAQPWRYIVGIRGAPEHIPQAYAERDQKPRTRLTQREILL